MQEELYAKLYIFMGHTPVRISRRVNKTLRLIESSYLNRDDITVPLNS